MEETVKSPIVLLVPYDYSLLLLLSLVHKYMNPILLGTN